MSGLFEVVVAPEVVAEVVRIVAWWQENRPAARRLFRDELDDALALLADHPEIGARATGRRLRGARRLVLRRSRYLLFCRVHAETQQVHVLLVRHARRRPI